MIVDRPRGTPVLLVGLAAWIGVCFAAAAGGAIATTPEIEGWYRTLTRPDWAPPDWLFGPVWTTLFAMMGVAAWLIWKQAGLRDGRRPLTWFAIQLLLNVAWSWIFFHFHQPGWAFVEILALWAAIAVTIAHFLRVQSAAGWLLTPYLAWVSFAAVLNFSIWRMN